MKKTFILLLLSALAFACNKKEEPSPEPQFKPYEPRISKPVVASIKVSGNTLNLKWSHDTKENVKYVLKLNDVVYENPARTFIQKVDYNTHFNGEIIAKYVNNQSTSAEFEFDTPKNKCLIIGTWSNTLYYIDLISKQVIWKCDTIYGSNNSIMIYKDLVLTTNASKIKAIDLVTGEIKWLVKPLPNSTMFILQLIDSNKLYFRDYTYDQTIALNLDTKEILWKSYRDGSPLALGDYIYISNVFSGNTLVALNKLSGDFVWGFDMDYNYTSLYGQISSQPVLYDNNLFFGDNIGRIYSVNATTGIKNWSIDMGQFISGKGAPVIYNGNLIIPIQNAMKSINTTSAGINWSYVNSYYINSSPFIYGNKIVAIGSYNGKSNVFVLDAETGKLLWSKEIDDGINSSPVVYDGFIYFGSYNKKLYEIDLNSGEITWQFTTNNVITDSPIIVVGSGEEVIYPNIYGMN